MQAEQSGDHVEGSCGGEHDQMIGNMWKLITADIGGTLKLVVDGVSLSRLVWAVS